MEMLDSGNETYDNTIISRNQVFTAYGYLENNEGEIVPVIYRNYDDEIDIEQPYYHVGRATIEGVEYDKWRKFEPGTFDWGSEGKCYFYTNVVTIVSTSDDDTEDSNYFANANLPAWELKYCLDNDTTRFAWADNEDGKGVIYYMKDEYNNECPYDFKNIQFQRDIDWQEEHSGFIEKLSVGVGDVEWFYTFSWINEALEVEDLTMRQDLVDDEGSNRETAYNKIRPYQKIVDSRANQLNNIVIINSYQVDNVFYGCTYNTFGGNCSFNTLGDGCRNNIFNNECSNNILYTFCKNNIFGYGCNSNIFGYSCDYNVFNMSCNSNIFGESCAYNTFDNYCYKNIFGDTCTHNIFKSSCSQNTLGDENSYNTFADRCYNNIFGREKDSLIRRVSSVQLSTSCSYIRLKVNETGNSQGDVQNVTVSSGVSGNNLRLLELEVSRNAAPVVFEAAGTTHIILD